MKELIPNHLKRGIKLTLRNIVQSFRYYVTEKRLSGRKKYRPGRVVFVCKGNVCRSAFAQTRLALLAGSNTEAVDSCGLEVNQGNFPPQESVGTAAWFGCDLSRRRAKTMGECDFKNADIILPMEYSQYRKLIATFPGKKDRIRLLREYAPFPFFLFCNIDDPYGWGDKVFRKTYRIIDKSIRGLI